MMAARADLKQQMADRFKEYTALRDTGSQPVDAERELGVSRATRSRYERSYRQLRHLPTPQRRPWI